VYLLCVTRKQAAKLIAGQEWDYEFPVLRDSVNFTQGEISRNQAFIHGSSRAYATAAGEPASTTLTFFVPSINEDVQTAFGNTASGTPATLSDGDGYWKPVGDRDKSYRETTLWYGYAYLAKTKNMLLLLRIWKGMLPYSLMLRQQNPLGYNVSFDVSGITEGDTDGDVVLYEYQCHFLKRNNLCGGGLGTYPLPLIQ